MSTRRREPSPASPGADGTAELLRQYGCGPVEFTGTDNALYERHLFFDNVVKLADAGPRERFEAFARAVRDILSQRWVLTEDTYARQNPKRVYYLSMEFLIGRSLANNVMNLWLDPWCSKPSRRRISTGWASSKRNRTPAWAMGARASGGLLSRLDGDHAVSGDGLWSAVRVRHLQAIYPGRLATGTAGQLAASPRPLGGRRGHTSRSKSSSTVRSRCAAGPCAPIPGRPSSLIGIPFDRPVVGYGGKTINTLRLWAAAAPDYFDFQVFSHGDFVGAVAETLTAESLTRVLYPDDSTSQGQGLRFVQEYFLVACSLADLVRRFRQSNTDWRTLPEKVAIQLNDTHPTLAVPELMRILLDDAHLGWDAGLGASRSGRWRTRTTRCCPRRWRNGRWRGSK